MFLVIVSPSSSCSSYSWNEWNVRHFFFFTQPCAQVFSVNGALTCRGLHFWLHFLVKHKILSNLVIRNWLWWIMRVLLAIRIGEIFWMNNNKAYFPNIGQPLSFASYCCHVLHTWSTCVTKHTFWDLLFTGCLIEGCSRLFRSTITSQLDSGWSKSNLRHANLKWAAIRGKNLGRFLLDKIRKETLPFQFRHSIVYRRYQRLFPQYWTTIKFRFLLLSCFALVHDQPAS